MSDINTLEGRITAALERISTGVDAMGAAPAAVGDNGLQTQLEEERTANAQLVERVKALKERQDTKIAELEARVSAQSSQLAELDGELQRMRASHADLREMNAQLRSVATEGAAEPELINRALIAEIDALHAQRSADAAEVDAILSELKPIIEEAS